MKIFHQPTSLFSQFPLPPTPPVGDAHGISLFASKGSLIALMIYSEYSPCVYLLSSFKIKLRFYFFPRDQNISKQRLKTLLVSFQQWRYVDSTFVFCYLTFFPSGSKYFKTKVENAISVVYAGGVWTCTDAEGCFALNNKHEEITALNNTFTCQQCLIRLEVKRMGREREYKLENY